MIYVLAFPRFEPAVSTTLDQFRARHEPERARLVKPHITLVFGLKGMESAEFVDFCKSIIVNQPAIKVAFDRVTVERDPYEQTYKLFLMCSRGREDIKMIHRALHVGPQNSQFDAAQPYEPHITIATNKDRAALETILPSSIGDFPIYGLVDRIEIVSLVEKNLQVLDVVELQ